jgi:hypothetical protein
MALHSNSDLGSEDSAQLITNVRLVALIHELAHALVAVDEQAPKLDEGKGECGGGLAFTAGRRRGRALERGGLVRWVGSGTCFAGRSTRSPS